MSAIRCRKAWERLTLAAFYVSAICSANACLRWYSIDSSTCADSRHMGVNSSSRLKTSANCKLTNSAKLAPMTFLIFSIGVTVRP